MKRNVPPSTVLEGHEDFPRLTELAQDITARAGGAQGLGAKVAQMLRGCIDDVIMTPKTGRRSYDELEKTEKTYIGTRVEIELRSMLRLPKGRLDTVICGQDVDIKHTMGSTWMIPTEAVGVPCILMAADETRARCYLGLIVARPACLSVSQNKDAKKSISAEGFQHILWLLVDHPYPRNFWSTVPEDAVDRVFAGASGNARVMQLLREVQGRVIARDVIEAVAQQKDFMRRLRADGGGGARDKLAAEGIWLLNGHYDSALIAALGLPACGASEFIAHRPRSVRESDLARAHGLELPALPGL
ncbi:MAG: NaeI family type II restriction endonuclease [Roseovarius sp.]